MYGLVYNQVVIRGDVVQQIKTVGKLQGSTYIDLSFVYELVSDHVVIGDDVVQQIKTVGKLQECADSRHRLPGSESRFWVPYRSRTVMLDCPVCVL